MSSSMLECGIAIATQLVELLFKNKGGRGRGDDMARRRGRKWGKRRRDNTTKGEVLIHVRVDEL